LKSEVRVVYAHPCQPLKFKEGVKDHDGKQLTALTITNLLNNLLNKPQR
jgi:hypothetical protein